MRTACTIEAAGSEIFLKSVQYRLAGEQPRLLVGFIGARNAS
jgi:hypothetical protein